MFVNDSKQAIVLAGGKGTRLRPFTINFPKPLVPIGDIPILEVVLRQLKHFGFGRIILAVNHCAELIQAFFGNGEKLGLRLEYIIEDRELGTAGPLAKIDCLDENFLVMNGDLLTTIDYGAFFQNHLERSRDATIAVYRKDVKIDLGVLKLNGNEFVDYIEKPTYSFEVSTGMYAFNRRVISNIPRDIKFDMPDYIRLLSSKGSSIGCYKQPFFWLDIGRVDDFETAVSIFRERESEFLHHG